MNTKIKKIMYHCDLCNKEFQIGAMYMKVNMFQGMELQCAENIVTKVIGMVGHIKVRQYYLQATRDMGWT